MTHLSLQFIRLLVSLRFGLLWSVGVRFVLFVTSVNVSEKGLI